jgi:KDO2-lipid IV(A) lauroyltransferase
MTVDVVNKVELLGDSPKYFNLQNFKFPNLRNLDILPKPLVRIIGKFLWVKANINSGICIKCLLCVKACPVGAIQRKGNDYLHVDTKKCISCFCCHEMRPKKAVGFKKSFLAKIFIKDNWQMAKRTRFRDYTEYIALRIIIFFIRLFPFKVAVEVGELLGIITFYVVNFRRSHVINMLTQAFPEKSKKEIGSIARNTYKNFARTVVEIIFFPPMTNEEIKKLLICTNENLVKESYSAGKGTIFMSAHLGNWELTALAYSKIYPMSVVVANQSNVFVDKMMDNVRTKQGFATISRDGMAFRAVMKALKRNEMVAFLADQDAGPQGVFVPFFCRLASTPKGAAIFALRAKCPIIIALGIRQKNGIMKVEFTKVPMPNTGTEEKDIEEINTFYSKKLEDIVRQYPEQWFWFHRKWKTHPE